MRRLRIALAAAGLLAAHALVPACSLTVEEGLAVELALLGEGDGGAIDEAWLHLERVALVPCADDGARAWLHGWLAVGPSRAAAHHASSDGRTLDAAHLVDVRPGASTVLGLLTPPPGRYCALSVTVSEASDGADGYREAMAGWTLMARGEGLDAHAFGARSVEIPLDPPLALDAASPRATLELGVDLGRALASLPERASDPVDLGLDLLLALDAATAARVAR